MLINSPFKDYYDFIKSLGIDKTIVYQRESKTIVLPWPGHRDPDHLGFGDKNRRYEATEHVIGFCGKLYPAIAFTHFESRVTKFIYAPAAALAEAKKLGWNKLPGLGFLVRTDIFQRNWSFLLPYFQEYKTPCFWLKFIVKDERNALALEINPCLKNTNFITVKDPPTAFQEISQYISGVLGVGEKETVSIDDKHKAIAHGHNGRYSFKRPPGPGKWR